MDNYQNPAWKHDHQHTAQNIRRLKVALKRRVGFFSSDCEENIKAAVCQKIWRSTYKSSVVAEQVCVGAGVDSLTQSTACKKKKDFLHEFLGDCKRDKVMLPGPSVGGGPATKF